VNRYTINGNMKKFSVLILIWFALNHAYPQTNSLLGVDCNPKLNEQEVGYLNNMFSTNNYDFKNKTIGFGAHHVNRICGIETIDLSGSWPIDKKQYFAALAQDNCKNTVSKLLVLNDDQKKESKGFDAIVLLIPKKKDKNITDRSIDHWSEVFGYRTLNYPDNLGLVGNDNRADLSDEDAVFFNNIYHFTGFDFNGKKIAFINPHLEAKESIRTKKEYIEKIKKHLESDFLYPTDHLEILNEQEKKESGGYDAMIVYQSKRYFKTQLIQVLKESSMKDGE